MTRAFIGISAGIVCGLLWGDATTESGGTIPLAIPLGVVGGVIGLALGRFRGRNAMTTFGTLAGGAAGALWGAASPDAVAVPLLAGILALAGAAIGRRLGRNSGEPAAPSAWLSWSYRRTAVGAGAGVLLGLAWGTAGDEGGGIPLAVPVGLLGAGIGCALDRTQGASRTRLAAALKAAAIGFFMGVAAFGAPDGSLGGALVGLPVGAALGWTTGAGFASALAWRPADEAAEVAPPSWAGTLSAAATTLRLPAAAGLGLAALVLFAHSVDAAVVDFKTANLVPGTFAAACALAYLAWAVHGTCLVGLGRAVRVPAEIGGPFVGRVVTFARRWRVPVVAALVVAGSGLVAQSFSATYTHVTYREHRDTHTERRYDGKYRVTRTTYTPVRNETGGETIWVTLVAGGLLLLGACRLHRGRNTFDAQAAPAPAV